MPQVVAFEDASKHQTRRKDALRTGFLESSRDTPDLPVAFLSQGDPGRVIKPHWHVVDQFQLIAEGRGSLGRHAVAPFYVHFTRAYTPYGPLSGQVSFFTLRSRFDPGAQYFPDSKERLRQVPERRPFQISRQVTFPALGKSDAPGGFKFLEIPGVKDDQGLFACALTMAPDTTTLAPDPVSGDGQYTIIVKGGLWHEGREHKALTLVFLRRGESAIQLRSGSDGLQAVIMNFPRVGARAAKAEVPSAGDGFRKWQCELCAFAYDEAQGLPDDGIAAGTRWQDVPDSWTCPDCSTSKSDFRMVEVP